MGRLKLPPKPRWLRGFPSNAMAMIGLLVFANLVIWAVVAAAVLSQVGGSLAFVTVKIVKVGDEGDEEVVVLAQHTKYVRGTAPSV
ncbi:hypothetical protein OCS_06882 [Ophiocordyceps sinensis CO18]|uniref:Uncharacterized protein n=1 Tax=Ophiocordyceps sinensis (strain Co18 / CGMCC 3.14243) TaxID=911162 RepID=T5A4S9_OPHSC|nr:hypothetical protein OCS_06882 [Ophiocordyceps sinensis CO18]